MKDQSQKLVTTASGPAARRMLRTAWAGAVATVTAGGLLFTAAAGAPAAPDGDEHDDPLIQARVQAQVQAQVRTQVGSQEAMAVEQARAVPQGVSPRQIEAVLERAERQAREQGPDLSPTVAQAAAELGMLYATYTAQELVLTERAEGLRLEDAPVARGAEQTRGAHDSTARAGSAEAAAGSAPAVQVSYVPGSATLPEADAHGTHGHTGQVTYDEVVIAAVRLANLLDAPITTAEIEVQRPEQDEDLSPQGILALPGAQGDPASGRSPLRGGLVDAVSAFGGSTLGYANGRIPAAVLCPLEFAPGHLLRCDAAELLTALSKKFEREFGYPIPITDSYRSYVQQVAVAHAKPHLAAVPGTSNHGWGLAVDLSSPISGGMSPEYTWLRVHGPDHGWDNPSWARPDGSKPEPWHFEFFAAGPVPDRAVDPSDVGTWQPTSGSGTSGTSPAHVAAGETRTPVKEPADTPRDTPRATPPAQQPAKPSKPAKPHPKPTPRPTPTPTPTPSEPKPTTPPAGPSPSPIPSPSEPSEEPSASPSPSPTAPSPTPPEPTPSAPTPSPSAPQEPTPSATPSSSAPSSSAPSAEPTSEPDDADEADA